MIGKNVLVISVLLLLTGIAATWTIDYFALNPFDEDVAIQKPFTELEPSTAEIIPENVDYRVEVFATGLTVPWDLTFTSADRLIVTERNGTVRQIVDGNLLAEPVHFFEEVKTQSEAGLMGATKDPDYENNKFLYFCYAYGSDGKTFDKVVRMTDQGNALEDPVTIIEGIPAAQYHAGCRVAFGPDEKLYITTGDATERELAQDLESLAGKILRINADGTVPEDNPFEDSPIFSLGHRNPQGLDWHPTNGELYSTEHGPSIFDGPAGGDEVNWIRSGENYGWPLVSHEKSQDGLVDPLIVYTPAVAPASGVFYDAAVFPQFENQFFFGGLRGEGLFRVEFSEAEPDAVVLQEKLAKVDVGRIRDVAVGPDGLIYFTTSNQDGRGRARDGDDKIYRLVPSEAS